MQPREVAAADGRSVRPTDTSSVQPSGLKTSLEHPPREVLMPRFRELALTGLVLGGVACSEPNGAAGLIGIQAEPAVREDGSFVMATIRNLSTDRLRFSTCSYRFEQPGPNSSWAAA